MRSVARDRSSTDQAGCGSTMKIRSSACKYAVAAPRLSGPSLPASAARRVTLASVATLRATERISRSNDSG